MDGDITPINDFSLDFWALIGANYTIGEIHDLRGICVVGMDHGLTDVALARLDGFSRKV